VGTGKEEGGGGDWGKGGRYAVFDIDVLSLLLQLFKAHHQIIDVRIRERVISFYTQLRCLLLLLLLLLLFRLPLPWRSFCCCCCCCCCCCRRRRPSRCGSDAAAIQRYYDATWLRLGKTGMEANRFGKRTLEEEEAGVGGA